MPIDTNKLRNLVNDVEAEKRSKQMAKAEEARLKLNQEYQEWDAKIEAMIANLETILEEAAKRGERSKRFQFSDVLCSHSSPPDRLFKKGPHPKYFHTSLQKLYYHCERQNLRPELLYCPSWGDGDAGYCYLTVSW